MPGVAGAGARRPTVSSARSVGAAAWPSPCWREGRRMLTGAPPSSPPRNTSVLRRARRLSWSVWPQGCLSPPSLGIENVSQGMFGGLLDLICKEAGGCQLLLCSGFCWYFKARRGLSYLVIFRFSLICGPVRGYVNQLLAFKVLFVFQGQQVVIWMSIPYLFILFTFKPQYSVI